MRSCYQRHGGTSGDFLVVSYNCTKCPGYCCSYPLIPLKKRDVQRLADHFDLSFEEANKAITAIKALSKSATSVMPKGAGHDAT